MMTNIYAQQLMNSKIKAMLFITSRSLHVQNLPANDSLAAGLKSAQRNNESIKNQFENY